MNDSSELDQQLWELVYDLLPAEEARELEVKIRSDRALARRYAEVRLQADLVTSASKLPAPAAELTVSSIDSSVAATPKRSEKVKHSEKTSSHKQITASLKATANFNALRERAVLAIAASLLLLMTGSGFFAFRPYSATQLAAQFPVVSITTDRNLIEGVSSHFSASVSDPLGNPLAKSFQASVINPQGTTSLQLNAEKVSDRKDAGSASTSAIANNRLFEVSGNTIQLGSKLSVQLDGIATDEYALQVQANPIEDVLVLEKPLASPGETIHYYAYGRRKIGGEITLPNVNEILLLDSMSGQLEKSEPLAQTMAGTSPKSESSELAKMDAAKASATPLQGSFTIPADASPGMFSMAMGFHNGQPLVEQPLYIVSPEDQRRAGNGYLFGANSAADAAPVAGIRAAEKNDDRLALNTAGKENESEFDSEVSRSRNQPTKSSLRKSRSFGDSQKEDETLKALEDSNRPTAMSREAKAPAAAMAKKIQAMPAEQPALAGAKGPTPAAGAAVPLAAKESAPLSEAGEADKGIADPNLADALASDTAELLTREQKKGTKDAVIAENRSVPRNEDFAAGPTRGSLSRRSGPADNLHESFSTQRKRDDDADGVRSTPEMALPSELAGGDGKPADVRSIHLGRDHLNDHATAEIETERAAGSSAARQQLVLHLPEGPLPVKLRAVVLADDVIIVNQPLVFDVNNASENSRVASIAIPAEIQVPLVAQVFDVTEATPQLLHQAVARAPLADVGSRLKVSGEHASYVPGQTVELSLEMLGESGTGRPQLLGVQVVQTQLLSDGFLASNSEDNFGTQISSADSKSLAMQTPSGGAGGSMPFAEMKDGDFKESGKSPDYAENQTRELVENSATEQDAMRFSSKQRFRKEQPSSADFAVLPAQDANSHGIENRLGHITLPQPVVVLASNQEQALEKLRDATAKIEARQSLAKKIMLGSAICLIGLTIGLLGRRAATSKKIHWPAVLRDLAWGTVGVLTILIFGGEYTKAPLTAIQTLGGKSPQSGMIAQAPDSQAGTNVAPAAPSNLHTSPSAPAAMAASSAENSAEFSQAVPPEAPAAGVMNESSDSAPPPAGGTILGNALGVAGSGGPASAPQESATEKSSDAEKLGDKRILRNAIPAMQAERFVQDPKKLEEQLAEKAELPAELPLSLLWMTDFDQPAERGIPIRFTLPSQEADYTLIVRAVENGRLITRQIPIISRATPLAAPAAEAPAPAIESKAKAQPE